MSRKLGIALVAIALCAVVLTLATPKATLGPSPLPSVLCAHGDIAGAQDNGTVNIGVPPSTYECENHSG